MAAIAIHTHKLTRVFDGQRAVDRLTFDVPAGIIFGLLGPKGAGKTTTIRLLLGLLPPTSGSAQVLGYDVQTQTGAIQAHTGALLDQTDWEESLSAEATLALPARAGPLAWPAQQARRRALLTHFGLWAQRRETVGAWSLERKRRLAIAQALLHLPALLLLDEPTTGLDTAAAATLRRDLAALVRREGTTVFLATDNWAEAAQICDTIGVLQRGKLVAVAAPDELQARGAVRVEIRGRGFTPNLVALLSRRAHVAAVRADEHHLWIDLLGTSRRHATDPMDSAPLVTLLVESGAEVEEVHKQAVGLADLFTAAGP